MVRAPIWCGLLCLLACGCADDGRLPTFDVSGKVEFPDGQPLAGGSIVCLCESGEHALCARGNIAADGTFSLGTYDVADGAIVGQHRVAIDPPFPDDYNPDAGPPPKVIHERFQDYATSGLEFRVTDDAVNEIVLKVSRE